MLKTSDRNVVPKYYGMQKPLTTIIRNYATDYPGSVKAFWAHVSLADDHSDRTQSWPLIFNKKS